MFESIIQKIMDDQEYLLNYGLEHWKGEALFAFLAGAAAADPATAASIDQLLL
jgi:hypothetical protein